MRGPKHRTRLGAAARRETILAAAIPEFAASGYDRTRVSDIAATVGVTEPVVFQNFGTKSGLFAAVLDRMSEEAVRYLSVLGAHSPDIADLLSVLLEHEHQDQFHGKGALGATLAEAANSSEPSIRKAGRRAHARMMEAVVELLRRGQHEGSIRGDIEATALGWLVLSQIHARQFRRAHSNTSPTLEHALLKALLGAVSLPRLRGRVGAEPRQTGGGSPSGRA